MVERLSYTQEVVTVTINPNEVIQERLATSMGLRQYSFIMSQVWNVDVSKDEEFQRVFNGYYGVRRNDGWREKYYEFFEHVKGQPVSYSDIIIWLYQQTGNIEASFSSKMLATFNPDCPIWDQYVLKNLNLQLKGYHKPERLSNAIQLYAKIQSWYGEFLETENAAVCIRAFDQALPSYTWISDTKKIDCFLWSMREDI